MVIAKGSGFVKKAGLITIAIILLAAGAAAYYHIGSNRGKSPADMGKGTLVKEYFGCRKYCI